MADVIDGEALAGSVREELRPAVETLADAGVRPALAVVWMSDDPADRRYVDLKLSACEALGIDAVERRVAPDAPAEELYETVAAACGEPSIHGVFVQVPLPDHVSRLAVGEAIDPDADVDCFHPTNVGRLVAGDPRFEPATPLAVERLLASADVDLEGADVVIVGRSDVVGKPLANVLLGKSPGRNATVTVCHSRTADLAAKTRRADVLVTAAGVPELVDGSMLSPGVAVVDASGNRVERPDGSTAVVGDVEFESAVEVASAITPVPGGVGPMTVAMLLRNTVAAASEGTSTPVDLP